ncbi:hypothetical protein K438DRAFT_1868689 [Mycena galopus ATCC 62051]|nr:hypothetical protein K438DRAFT_1868689 [Mycena galopus ATCC 62051]
MLASMEPESQHRLRREAQRREQDTVARKVVRQTAKGASHDHRRSEPWWDHIALLNSAGTKASVGLHALQPTLPDDTLISSNFSWRF